MKKLLLGLIASILSTSAIMAQSFLDNNEENVRNAYTLYMSRSYSSSFLYELHIPLYVNYPKNGTVKFCWYNTKMVFGEEVRTSESPSRTEEGTYVDGRLSMYKSNDGYIYKFNWGNVRDMVLLESIVQYNSTGNEMSRSQRSTEYQWEKEKIISARVRKHVRNLYMHNALITQERSQSTSLYLEGYKLSGDLIREKHSSYYKNGYWHYDLFHKMDIVLRIMPDGRFPSDSPRLFDFNNNIKCESYVY